MTWPLSQLVHTVLVETPVQRVDGDGYAAPVSVAAFVQDAAITTQGSGGVTETTISQTVVWASADDVGSFAQDARVTVWPGTGFQRHGYVDSIAQLDPGTLPLAALAEIRLK